MLVLKTVRLDGTAYGGFKWPLEGPVECPDWDPAPECGNGLHGWANGEGEYVHTLMHPTKHLWLVVDVPDGEVIKFHGKVKFRAGRVVYSGPQEGAVRLLKERGALTTTSDPGWCCFTPAQNAALAKGFADRANRAAASSGASYASSAASYAASYASYAYASASASSAASSAASYASASYAAAAAYAYASSASSAAEREQQRLDKVAMLGL